MQQAVEQASRLKVTGWIGNAHLIEETTPLTVVEGWRLARTVSESTDVPLRCVAVMEELAASPEMTRIDAPLLRMQRYMLPPWRQVGADPDDADPLPAANPVPLGKPVARKFLSPEGDENGQDRR